jgi:hypothetical protein
MQCAAIGAGQPNTFTLGRLIASVCDPTELSGIKHHFNKCIAIKDVTGQVRSQTNAFAFCSAAIDEAIMHRTKS